MTETDHQYLIGLYTDMTVILFISFPNKIKIIYFYLYIFIYIYKTYKSNSESNILDKSLTSISG